MDEYISRGDVLDIASQYCPDDDGSCSKADVDLREMLDEIKALPAADAQSVVRCKDCIYLNRHDCPMAYIEHQTLQFAAVTPDFYCAKGADHEP